MRKPSREEVAAKWLMWAADNSAMLQLMAADVTGFTEAVDQMLRELDAAKKPKKAGGGKR